MGMSAPTLDEIKDKLDFVVKEAQDKRACSKILLEVNVTEGGIADSYISAKLKIKAAKRQ
jgi:hypothetical protein